MNTTRAIAILIVPLEEGASNPGWATGPLEMPAPWGAITPALRRTYFEPRVADRLYGCESRWHVAAPSWPEAAAFGVPLALELLLLDGVGPEGGSALLAVHVQLRGDDTVAEVAALHGLARDEMLPPKGLLRTYVEDIAPSFKVPSALTRAFAITLHLADEDRAACDPQSSSEGWGAHEEELFRLAASVPAAGRGGFPLHPSSRDDMLRSFVPLSADWEALVLRDGAAFRGLTADSGEEDHYFRSGEAYVRSVYLDAFLLGEAQRIRLSQIADDVAAIGDPLRSPNRLNQLERDLTTFRNTFWWQHVTRHGHATDLLRAYRAQHRLDELAEQTTGELTDFNDQIRTAASERQSIALERLAYIGLPFAVAIPVGEALQVGDWGQRASIAVAVLVVAAIANAKGWLDESPRD